MATQFVRVLPIPKIQVFTTPGASSFDATQVPIGPDGKRWVWVEALGGGGAGAGTTGNSGRGGGGAGGRALGWVDITGETSITVTVGAGGSGGTGAGGNGGNSTFGAFLTGGGGSGAPTSFTLGFPDPGSGGSGSGGDINSVGASGQLGANAAVGSERWFRGGGGGDSPYGSGGVAVEDVNPSGAVNGNNATGFGAGGGGGMRDGSGSATGGNGSPGLVIVQWFA